MSLVLYCSVSKESRGISKASENEQQVNRDQGLIIMKKEARGVKRELSGSLMIARDMGDNVSYPKEECYHVTRYTHTPFVNHIKCH